VKEHEKLVITSLNFKRNQL